jgi:predicted nucleic acid-binding protein
MVVFDSTMMLLVIRPDVNPPIDTNTKLPVEYVEARISGLIELLENRRDKIILPTPVLSEILIRAGEDAQSIVNTIQKSPVFRIIPFDTLAAIEVAAMTRKAINDGNKRGGVDCSWAKVKYDRQIIAIAKVHRATVIYSDDEDIRTHAEANNIQVVGIADLPIPQDVRQGKLFDVDLEEDISESEKKSVNNTDEQEK